jgi:hypothetical protein
MLSESAPSPQGPIPQILGEATKPPASQPQPQEEKQRELRKEQEERQELLKQQELQEQQELLKQQELQEQQELLKQQELQEQQELLKQQELQERLAPPKQQLEEPPKQQAPRNQQAPPKQELEEPPRENDYRGIVLHAVDLSLDTLGRDGKHAVLSLLENRYGLRESDIPDHPRGFVVLLDELLGASAQNLEREIMSNIRLVSAAPGENLEAVIRSLKGQRRAEAPAETAADGSKSDAADADTAGFRYGATYSKRRD